MRVLWVSLALWLGSSRVVAQPTPPALSNADSVVRRYLSLIVERDNFAPSQFAGLWSSARQCEEESFGDVIRSYWLARGQPLRFYWRADTLRAVLELLTVASQEPAGTGQYDSFVRARVRLDTLEQKLVVDDTGKRWQLCGLLSDGHTLGGYGRPDNVRYGPTGTTRASLLMRIDSLQQTSRTGRPNGEL